MTIIASQSERVEFVPRSSTQTNLQHLSHQLINGSAIDLKHLGQSNIEQLVVHYDIYAQKS
jgi:hypothetical protein